MALETEHHGGGCCGLSHLYNFQDHFDYSGRRPKRILLTEDMLRAAVEDQTNSIWDDREGDYDLDKGEYTRYEPDGGMFGTAFEVVITDTQMERYGPMLKRFGFQFLFRWLNDNSGNYCNLLMYRTKEPADKPPFDWEKM